MYLLFKHTFIISSQNDKVIKDYQSLAFFVACLQKTSPDMAAYFPTLIKQLNSTPKGVKAPANPKIRPGLWKEYGTGIWIDDVETFYRFLRDEGSSSNSKQIIHRLKQLKLTRFCKMIVEHPNMGSMDLIHPDRRMCHVRFF